jgi:hypothetical protein
MHIRVRAGEYWIDIHIRDMIIYMVFTLKVSEDDMSTITYYNNHKHQFIIFGTRVAGKVKQEVMKKTSVAYLYIHYPSTDELLKRFNSNIAISDGLSQLYELASLLYPGCLINFTHTNTITQLKESIGLRYATKVYSKKENKILIMGFHLETGATIIAIPSLNYVLYIEDFQESLKFTSRLTQLSGSPTNMSIFVDKFSLRV